MEFCIIEQCKTIQISRRLCLKHRKYCNQLRGSILTTDETLKIVNQLKLIRNTEILWELNHIT